jgi:ATPase subunit of ABC transporter with duplicated ATPase domains
LELHRTSQATQFARKSSDLRKDAQSDLRRSKVSFNALRAASRNKLDVLNSDLTVAEQLQQDFPQDSIGALRNLAGAFQFSGDDVDRKTRALSGGEKSLLAIARVLYNPPNFLVLDEPTNHLDLATKEMLVDALKDFEAP